VELTKLVDYPFRKRDFSYFDTKRYRRDPVAEDPETLLDRLPDVSPQHPNIGAFYELLVPRLSSVNANAAGLKTIIIEDGYYYDPRCEVRISAEILTAYPVLSSSYLLLNEPFFARLERYLDRDYFLVKELTVGS
jgi:hypothetical protein